MRLCLLLVAWAVAVGCSRKPAEKSEILIGEVGSLTGGQGMLGTLSQRGTALAIDEVNAAGGIGGRRVLVRSYDDRSRPEESASAAARLIAQDAVALILSESSSAQSLAMAPQAQAAHVPMICSAATHPKVTEGRDYVFRVCFVDPFQGAVMARFAHDTLSVTRAAILQDEKSDYSLGLSDVFAEKLKALGGAVAEVQAYSSGDTDFRAQLTAIKKARPEALFVPGFYAEVGLIARQAKELGLGVRLLGGDGWESDKLFELGGDAVEGSYFTSHYSAEDPSPQVQQFIAPYRKVYGEAPSAPAALAYDAARVALDAIKRSKSLRGADLREALSLTRHFPGATGSLSFDSDRNVVKSAVVLQVKGGQRKFVLRIAP